MKKNYKNPSNFEECLSGQDFIGILENQGADIRRVNSKWISVRGQNGCINLPDTPNHLSKAERRKYIVMLRWIGFLGILTLLIMVVL